MHMNHNIEEFIGYNLPEKHDKSEIKSNEFISYTETVIFDKYLKRDIKKIRYFAVCPRCYDKKNYEFKHNYTYKCSKCSLIIKAVGALLRVWE